MVNFWKILSKIKVNFFLYCSSVEIEWNINTPIYYAFLVYLSFHNRQDTAEVNFKKTQAINISVNLSGFKLHTIHIAIHAIGTMLIASKYILLDICLVLHAFLSTIGFFKLQKKLKLIISNAPPI